MATCYHDQEQEEEHNKSTEERRGVADSKCVGEHGFGRPDGLCRQKVGSCS